MSRIAAIIQSRTASTRLPQKVLRQMEGKSLTEHIIKRVQAVGVFDSILLAIPDSPAETELIALAESLNVPCIQGPEEDVLERFIQAGEFAGAEHVLRVCGDNPLVDLQLMGDLARIHLKENADYTVCADPIPLGTGTEMVRLQSLKTIRDTTREPRYREHVTTWFQDHPEDFALSTVTAPWYLRNIQLRLTVDTMKDYELLALLYGRFFLSDEPVNLEEAIQFLGKHPEIASHNADVIQKDWRA